MENNNINKLHIYQKVHFIESEMLKDAYIKSELEKSPELIESNIFNRLLLDHEVLIREDFLNKN
jgi:hypothetical protein